MEWYDFAVFGYLAGPLGHAFFPHVGGAWPLIASFSVFAAGYVMRPVGSLLLGPVGDRLGRRTMLSFSITLMGVASAGIAVLPTAARWGVGATALRVALRLLQGLSLGGEWSGGILVAVEQVEPRRRGFYAALPQLGSPVGTTLTAAWRSRGCCGSAGMGLWPRGCTLGEPPAAQPHTPRRVSPVRC